MSIPEKRRNWTPEEDLKLLVQVAADLPFAAEKGQITKAWQALADALMGCDDFIRIVDGRRVQNRFTALVEEHRRFDAASAILSGVDEDETEKHVLLDDLVALLDDAKNDVKRSSNANEKEKIENEGQIVREMAMQTMKRRSDNSETDDSKKKAAVDNRRNSLAAAIASDSEREQARRDKELDFKRFKFESEMKQREYDREERKAERDHQLALARLESEKISSLLKAVLEGRK
ncbi:hypothetical protein LEN26_017244 [Aphanomyces euteiches]|nr:hypothetical protein LEN26_017244 [Aphanomyces euteiches]KAH9103028.1 hypothetical protein AeMF1_020524 [Aphanomyces euteiches]KAH9127039.1 hypothetical protein AeMF1_002607 [Aphanomyces euteiches]